ncbi:extracellular solute-binding protein [[Clostridium] cellulosi]
MKKAAALAVLAVIAFFAVVFSTFYGINDTKATQNSESKSKIKLTFMNSWGGYDTKASVVEQLFDEFQEKEKNTEIVNQTLSGDDFLPTIKEKFATGSQPDVFGLWPGSDIRTLIKAGKVADLTNLITSDPKWYNSFDTSMWPQVMQNGKIYGLPVEITFEGLFINKDLFDRYNVKVPENYEDLKKAIVTFKNNNIIPIAYNCKPEGSYLYQNIVMSLDGKNVENPFINGKIRDSYIKAMYIMRELRELGAFPNDNECFTMESNARDDLFLQKKAAMIVQGSWFVDKCKTDTVELVPFPRMTENSPNAAVYCLGCGTFYISQKAWNDPVKKEAAIKLLRFLTSKEACEKLAVQSDMISCVKLDESKIKYNKLTKSGIKMVNDASVLVGAPDSYITRSVWESVIIRNFPDMLCNKISPEELWNMAIEAGAEEK